MCPRHIQNESFSLTNSNKVHKEETLSFYQKSLLFMLYRKNTNSCSSSAACSHIQGRNRFPRMNKVLPPPMHGRYFHSYLTSIRDYLGGNQPDTTPYPLDVLLSVRFWQYQVPYPERQVIGQLRAQQIYPVCKKLFHRKVTEKLIRKLANPFLTLPTFRMGLHKPLDFALTIGYYRIVRICHRLKERTLACLGSFPVSFLSHTDTLLATPQADTSPRHTQLYRLHHLFARHSQAVFLSYSSEGKPGLQ